MIHEKSEEGDSPNPWRLLTLARLLGDATSLMVSLLLSALSQHLGGRWYWSRIHRVGLAGQGSVRGFSGPAAPFHSACHPPIVDSCHCSMVRLLSLAVSGMRAPYDIGDC